MATLPGFGITVPDPQYDWRKDPGVMNADYSGLSGLQGLDLTGIGLYGPAPTGSATPQGTTPPPPQKSAEDLYWEQRAAAEAAARTAAQDATAAAVQNLFESYGLSGMYNTILDYARRGYGADTILLHLRQTPEYKARFPAMEALNKQGRAMTEAQYVDYEKQAAAIEQRYGFPKGMVMGSVTDLLVGNVSAAELNDRAQIAVADSLQAPDDLKNTLRDYYGLDPETALRAYYLDPNKALPLLEKQSASARIGTWAARQGVTGVDRGLAEDLQGFGVTEAEAEQGFGRVAYQSGLGAGKGDVATQSQRIDANLRGDATAIGAVERAASSRRGRFEGGGQFASSRQGMAGIGSA